MARVYFPRMVSGYSTASNMRVPYVVLGEGTPAVLVIPGIEPVHRIPDGLRLQGVRGAFEELAEAHALAVAWRADRPADEISLDSIADDYVDLVRELEIADVAILGISTGAPMAIETAARLGSRCKLLALAAGGAYVSEPGRLLLRRSIELAQTGQWRSLARMQIAALYPDPVGRTLLAAVAWTFPTLYGTPNDPSFYTALTRIAEQSDLRERATDVTARSIVINGERDLLYPPEIATETALMLMNGEAVALPRAGHGVFKSRAGRIRKLLLPRLLEALGPIR